MRVLLHACCGPCLLEPLDAIRAEFQDATVLFANPNIHPAEEYERRRDTLMEYAGELGIDVIELPYDPASWAEKVGPLSQSGAARCRACYRLRLGLAAGYAAQNGFDALATTLTVSPYQDADAIRDEGQHAAAEAGIEWLDRDFRDRYPEATRRSRELGMYRQNYCGCVYSKEEARVDREARREERRQAKLATQEAGQRHGSGASQQER